MYFGKITATQMNTNKKYLENKSSKEILRNACCLWKLKTPIDKILKFKSL